MRRPCRARNAPKVSSRSFYRTLTNDQICLLTPKIWGRPSHNGQSLAKRFRSPCFTTVHDFFYVQTGIQDVRACQTFFFPSGPSPLLQKAFRDCSQCHFWQFTGGVLYSGMGLSKRINPGTPLHKWLTFVEAVSVPRSLQECVTSLRVNISTRFTSETSLYIGILRKPLCS